MKLALNATSNVHTPVQLCTPKGGLLSLSLTPEVFACGVPCANGVVVVLICTSGGGVGVGAVG